MIKHCLNTQLYSFYIKTIVLKIPYLCSLFFFMFFSISIFSICFHLLWNGWVIHMLLIYFFHICNMFKFFLVIHTFKRHFCPYFCFHFSYAIYMILYVIAIYLLTWGTILNNWLTCLAIVFKVAFAFSTCLIFVFFKAPWFANIFFNNFNTRKLLSAIWTFLLFTTFHLWC